MIDPRPPPAQGPRRPARPDRLAALGARLLLVPLVFPRKAVWLRWSWRHVASGCGLTKKRRRWWFTTVPGLVASTGVVRVKRRFQRVAVDTKPWMGLPRPVRHGFRITFHLLDGQVPDDYAKVCERLAHAWRIEAVRVVGSRPGRVTLQGITHDPLTHVAPAMPPAEPRGRLAGRRPAAAHRRGPGDRRGLADGPAADSALDERGRHPVGQVQPDQRAHRRPGPATGRPGRLRPQRRGGAVGLRRSADRAGHHPHRVPRPAQRPDRGDGRADAGLPPLRGARHLAAPRRRPPDPGRGPGRRAGRAVPDRRQGRKGSGHPNGYRAAAHRPARPRVRHPPGAVRPADRLRSRPRRHRAACPDRRTRLPPGQRSGNRGDDARRPRPRRAGCRPVHRAGTARRRRDHRFRRPLVPGAVRLRRHRRRRTRRHTYADLTPSWSQVAASGLGHELPATDDTPELAA